jgi:hypothetical protein
MGGQIGEFHEVCRPLDAVAGMKDSAAEEFWYQSWIRMAERLETPRFQ